MTKTAVSKKRASSQSSIQFAQPAEPLSKKETALGLPQAAVWSLAFRPFFLLGALWAVIALIVWALWFSGHGSHSFVLPPSLWHAHEMVFGFAAMIAVGFLLTAVQTWTGLRSAHGVWLIMLSGLWIVARISGVSSAAPWGLGFFICSQLLWWLGVIGCFSYLVIKARNTSNYILIALLGGLFSLNLIFFALVNEQAYVMASQLVQSAVLLFCVLITVIGGRVIPFFTARALNRPQVKHPRFDLVLLVFSLLAVALFIIQFFTPVSTLTAIVLVVLGVGHLWRLGQWFAQGVWAVSLLWSLHFAYLAMAIGLSLVGVSLLTSCLPLKDSLHLISISAISAMILSMMSRVSLGHTGRALVVSRGISAAFALLLVAGFVRVFASLSEQVLLFWQLSAWLWSTAFILFFVYYWPVLTKARVDGKPG
ncbi:NnrS [Paraglaciecola sp. T6c]|uniref:NnrS family protein n=1 Tax=Pseudoalteromonas atlantica (strain T6c / ATCC BAA-1087) TaxID=3042615 RepID=UPI00005C5C62|nr:NnrS family protein [Paraglaciecola sp. T6c]ABG41975.1 NnrS [Paraglaciecola sp. T6c]